MAMRLSGLMSGMDTESIVEQLVLARRTKVDTTKKAQTKLQWKSEAWKTLNSKILKFYNGVLGSSMRFEGSYMKKVTKVSNSSVVSVITGDSAMNSVQSLTVKKLAKSAYLTGGQVGHEPTASELAGNPKPESTKGKLNMDSGSRLTKMGNWTFDDRGTIKVTVGGEEKEITVTGATTMGDLVKAFRDAGLEASFDEKNQRFYIAAKGNGAANDFSICAGDATGLAMLQDLGLSYMDEGIAKTYQEYIEKNSNVEAWQKSRLNELTAERKDILNSLNVKIEELKKSFGLTDENLDDIYDVNGNVNFDALRDKIVAMGDEEKLAEFDSKLAGSFKNLSGRLNNVDRYLEKDENGKLNDDGDGNYILTADEKKAVADKVKAMIEPFKSLLSSSVDEKGNFISDPASGAHMDAGEDAVIELNGVEYTSSKNTFEINGLTLTVNSTTADGEVVTLTTQDDTDGIYDMIKGFIKEYSELINEMDKLYNAESSKGYEPLTSEEKEAMSESEIEEWETKIKDSLLRRDDTLGTLSNALKQLMLEGVTVNGQKMYLSNFGIETLSYFTAGENEKNAYHIDGDPDDPNTKSNEDKLRAMIATDPQTVIDFFVGLSRNMYAEMTTRMARTEYSSAYTAYEDVKMKKEYDDYTSKIKELEKKLSDYEDKWYQKFAQMETALAKLQSSASAVTSLLGG